MFQTRRIQNPRPSAPTCRLKSVPTEPKPQSKTRPFGNATIPTDDSYSAEPMAIASTVYKWFGVQNPQVLTQDSVMNPSGDGAINEQLNGIGVVRG